ncbi:MAG: trypsin-like peptidase domain-containing protein [Desulfovibrionaceae bacterium]|nr:trypsin-like peptidase domain-containing protein [Desulfovibrionaceae bacterium]
MGELVADRDYAQAATVYDRQADWFAQNLDNPDIRHLLDQVAAGLKAERAPELESALSRVREMEWPTAPGNWNRVKVDLAALQTAVGDVSGIGLFRNPTFAWPLVGEAQKSLDEKREAILASAPAEFAQYPVQTAESFFSAYPAELPDRAFMAEQADAWTKAVAAADGPALLHLNKVYGPLLSEEEKSRLARSYFTIRCPAAGKADMKTIMAAMAEVGENGLELASVPGVKIAFLEGTSQVLRDKGVIEFPVGVDMDLPFEAVNGDLKKGFESKAVREADIVILFNLASTRIDRRVDTSNYVKSTYLAGYQKVPNPEWDVLQVELQQANTEVLTATTEKLNTNTGDPWVNLGNAIANIGTESKIDEAKDKIEELKQKVRETPRYIDEPVYEPYRYQRVEMEVLKAGSVQYYIIDQRKKRYYTDFFDVSAKEFFTVAYNLSDQDPDLEKHTSVNVTEEMVDAYEKEPITVKLSELLDQYAANKVKARKLTSLNAIRKDVIKNRNVAVASAEKQEYGFDRRDDKRFESVVRVNNSSGFGTGFYVTDDVVLTNYHVVEEQKFVEMKKWDKTETFGKVFAKDVRLDLALVKVQDRGAPVCFYSSRTIKIGETVEAIGHPKGNDFTLTRGVISTIREHTTITGVKGKPVLFIQTDTPINCGNSGGPLFYGDKVVGVNDWGFSKQIAEGLNFSIHYSEVFKFLDDNGIAYRKDK